MKRIMIFIFAIMIIFVYHISTYAAEAIMDSDNILNDDVAQILSSQLTTEEKEVLNGIEGFDVSNDPVLKIYNEINWSLASTSAEEMIAEADIRAQTNNYKDYYILCARPYRIRINNNREAAKVSSELPQYIKDIIDLSDQVTNGEKQLAIKGVYCFDGSNSHDGIIVFILTEESTIVKYYELPNSKAILFPETEFQAYANDYYTYLTSYDNNFDENGEPTGGGTLSFKAFIDNSYVASSEPASETSNSRMYLWLGFAFVLTISLAVIGYTLYKKFNN